MQLELKKQPIAACELLLDQNAEHSIESDVLLPDYCPDIVRVLYCQVTSASCDTAVKGQSLLVDGMASITLCYLGEVGGIRKTEYKVPFSKTFELACEPCDPILHVSVEQGYLNCRATSKRRVDIRGTLLISVRVWHCAMQQAVTKAEGMGIQLKTQQLNGVRPAGQTTRQIPVREELSPPMGKSVPAELLRITCNPVVQECRVSAGKAVMRAELLVHMLYKTDLETGETETCDYTLPQSFIVELDGFAPDCHCEGELCCLSVECSGGEPVTDGRMLLEVQLAATIRMFAPIEVSGATDSYSTEYQSEAVTDQVRVPNLLGTLSDKSQVRAELPPPEDFKSVADIWVNVTKPAYKTQGDRLTSTCQVNFTILCKTSEGGFECISHSTDAAIEVNVPHLTEQLEFVPRFTAISPSAMLSGGKLQLSCELILTGTVLGCTQQDLIVDLTVDESSPRRADPEVGMIICYADAGEGVWDIAKRYNASPVRIMAENSLEDEAIQKRTALIIPT